MFNVGDLVIYSTHGICQIDKISDKTMSDVTRQYYVLHPVDDPSLKISTPVDHAPSVMQNIMKKDEAEALLEQFKEPSKRWNENNNQRSNSFAATIRKGDRNEIASIANTLMRREKLLELNGKTLGARDNTILADIQNNLFNEMALSLNTTYKAVEKKVYQCIMEHLG